jgi:tripartite-type tricarboxylate transporter receptor subunit TctC
MTLSLSKSVNSFLVCFTLLVSAGANLAFGQTNYPDKPIRIVVPYAAGGPNDVMARLISRQLTIITGQPVVVDNKPGAGGVIGTDAVAKAAPDGFTIGFISAPFTMAPALQTKMPYDTLKDLAPVTKVAESPMVVMVPSSSQFKTLQELIAYAKKNPGVLNYGSGGIGSTPHLTTELLNSLLGTKLTHVPYKGGGESIKALMGGEIDVLIDSVTSTDGPISSGKIRAIGVGSKKRIAKMPSVPTIEELGIKNFSVTHWVGIVAPAKTPTEIINQLNADVVKALKSPEVSKRFKDIGAEPIGNNPDDFGKFIANEVLSWNKTVKAANIQPQ